MKVYSEQDRHISVAIVMVLFTILCFIVGCEPVTEQDKKVEILNKRVTDLPIGVTNVKILDNPSSAYPHRTWVKFTLDDKDILLMEEGYGDSKVVSMVILR